MSTPRFTKAKAWIGKDLTLHVGGGDRKIRDHETLYGPQWAKFAGMGFLTQLPDEATKPAATAPVAPPAEVKSEGSITRSGASKLAGALEGGGSTQAPAKVEGPPAKVKGTGAPADIDAMSREQLQDFARENNLPVDLRRKEDHLRAAVREALAAATEGSSQTQENGSEGSSAAKEREDGSSAGAAAQDEGDKSGAPEGGEGSQGGAPEGDEGGSAAPPTQE